MSDAPLPPRPESAGIELAPGVRVDEGALSFSFVRSSGPGGQNVNKVNTKAELRVPVAAIRGLPPDAFERLVLLAGRRLTSANELVITAQATRSHEANREDALDRLRALVAQALRRPRPRRPTKPSRASKRRRVEAKRRRSQTKSLRRGPVGE